MTPITQPAESECTSYEIRRSLSPPHHTSPLTRPSYKHSHSLHANTHTHTSIYQTSPAADSLLTPGRVLQSPTSPLSPHHSTRTFIHAVPFHQYTCPSSYCPSSASRLSTFATSSTFSESVPVFSFFQPTTNLSYPPSPRHVQNQHSPNTTITFTHSPTTTTTTTHNVQIPPTIL